MSRTGLKFLTEQAVLIRECKAEIESTKLTVWRLKAELDELQSQFARVEKQLCDNEGNFEKEVAEGRRLRQEVSEAANNFGKDHCKALLAGSGKTRLAQIVAEATCCMCGFEERTWEFFQRLATQFHTLQDAMLSFDPGAIAPSELSQAQELCQSQNLAKLHKNDAVPRELRPLTKWLLAACKLTALEISAQDAITRLPVLSREKNELYGEVRDLEEEIREEEAKLGRLLQCVHMAERIVRKVRQCEEVSQEEVEQTENLWRESSHRDVGVENIITHIAKSEECRVLREFDSPEGANSASLVTSVYVSHAISPQLQGQLRAILERNTKEDASDESADHSETLHVPKPSHDDSASAMVLASTDSQDISSRLDARKKPRRRKNRCCGFV